MLKSGRAGLARQQARVDALRLERRRPALVGRRIEQDLRTAARRRTSRGGSSPRRAGPRPSRHSRARRSIASGPRPSAIARSTSIVPVIANSSPFSPLTWSVSCPPQSVEWRTKPRPGSTGPPWWTAQSGASPGSISSCRSSPRKLMPGALVADADPDRAILVMDAHRDDRALETRVGHSRHRQQQLAGQESGRLDPSSRQWAGTARAGQDLRQSYGGPSRGFIRTRRSIST